MRIYQITRLGKRLARSVKAPDTPARKVLSYLDARGTASDDQIKSYTEMDGATISEALHKLRRNYLVEEV